MKAVTVYKLNDMDILTKLKGESTPDTTMFQHFQFRKCGEADKTTIGFVPTLIDGMFVSHVGKFTILTIQSQDRKPSKAMVADLINVKSFTWLQEHEGIEDVPKTVMKEIKEESNNIALAAAYPELPKQFNIVFTDDGYIYVEATGKTAENITACLRKVLGSLPINFVCKDYANQITDFLDGCVVQTSDLEKNTKLTLGEKVKLISEEECVAEFKKSNVEYTDAANYIKDGWMVDVLALNYDGVVDFTLNTGFEFSGLQYDASLKEVTGDDDSKAGKVIAQVGAVDATVKEIIAQFKEEE